MFKERAQKVGQFLKKYDRHVVAFSLLTGFLFDNWLLSSVDVLWNNLLLGSYLLIVPIGIIVFHMVEERALTGWKAKFISAVLPLFIQFSFGNLFSGLIIFYSRSANVLSTWVFVLLLVGLVILNESFSDLYRRFRYQIALWFFLALTFSAFFLPVVIAQIGPWVFFLSIIISAALLAGFIRILRWLLPNRMSKAENSVIVICSVIAGAFVFLYALNLIPPLPLALKDASVAHSVVRAGDTYELSVEEKPWWEFFSRYSSVYHFKEGESAYAYAAIFAPTDLSVNIVHEWRHYREETDTWDLINTVKFKATGGRDGGYRGYSLTNRLSEGAWRVDVKTDYGAVIGRISFDAVPSSSEPKRTIEIR